MGLHLFQYLNIRYASIVKLIAQVKLTPSREQSKLLKETLERANAACDAISELAWSSKTFGQYAIHKLYYSQIREQFGLSAQIIVRCIAKVADAYKLDKQTERRFKPLGAIAFDDRILTWRTEKRFVNIWTIGGRQPIPFVCGERQKRILESRQGESDLVYRKGKFFLLTVCEIPKPTTQEIDDAIGVDFGIVNIATDSDGQIYSGKAIEKNRRHYAKRRGEIQKIGTRSAHRKLKKLSGKQRRYQADTNHVISKKLVEKAKDTNRAIALEELKGIGKRTTVRKSQRAKHANWAFSQLRIFIEYKAQLVGVPVIAVDARYTSQTCSACGHCKKANRKSQSEFVCNSCGHNENADYNAAKNIRLRAAVNQPMVSETQVAPSA